MPAVGFMAAMGRERVLFRIGGIPSISRRTGTWRCIPPVRRGGGDGLTTVNIRHLLCAPTFPIVFPSPLFLSSLWHSRPDSPRRKNHPAPARILLRRFPVFMPGNRASLSLTRPRLTVPSPLTSTAFPIGRCWAASRSICHRWVLKPYDRNTRSNPSRR